MIGWVRKQLTTPARGIFIAAVLAFGLIQFPYHSQSHPLGAAGQEAPASSHHDDAPPREVVQDFHPNLDGEHDSQCDLSLACVAGGWVWSSVAVVRAPGQTRFVIIPIAETPQRTVAREPDLRPPRQFS